MMVLDGALGKDGLHPFVLGGFRVTFAAELEL